MSSLQSSSKLCWEWDGVGGTISSLIEVCWRHFCWFLTLISNAKCVGFTGIVLLTEVLGLVLGWLTISGCNNFCSCKNNFDGVSSGGEISAPQFREISLELLRKLLQFSNC